jgi:hypothetical protein
LANAGIPDQRSGVLEHWSALHVAFFSLEAVAESIHLGKEGESDYRPV